MIKKTTLMLVLANVLFAQSVTLDEAINIALKNNKNMKVSDTSLQIADTLYGQAMSAHYPTIDVSMVAMRLDEAPTFDMRGNTKIDNTQTIAMYQGLSGAAAADGDAYSSGAYAAIAANTPQQTTLPINMDVQMMGRNTVLSKVDFILPLYTGGKIRAIVEQAKQGKAIAQQGKVRTRNQVIYDVKKYYYGVVLAKQLKKLTADTLVRMGFVRDLTEELYKGGSMTVKKTDYLRSKMSVNMVALFHEELKAKEIMAKAALANVLGYTWEKEIDVKDRKLPVPIMNKNMKSMVKQAYKSNPDYKTLKLAINVQDAKIDEVRSQNLPSLALVAGAQNINNDYEYGVINQTNNNSWNVGVALQWSLFNGNRTSKQIEQNKLEKLKLQQQESLLEDGLALQIKQAYQEMKSTYNKFKLLLDAVKVAHENTDLNTRAYGEDMVETKDVIESQLFEALTQADYYRSQNDHALAHAKAELIIGSAAEVH